MNDKIRIVTLCENYVEPSFGLTASHGFSLFIEFNGKKFIYDIGQDDTFIKNAKKLNIKLADCKNLIVSHGHFDHAGALDISNSIIDGQKVIIHEQAFKNKYRVSGTEKFNIGLRFNKSNDITGKDFKDTFTLVENFFILSNIPSYKHKGSTEEQLMVEDGENITTDTFSDELSLAIKTKKGLIVISACSHNGCYNIIKHAQNVTKEKRIAYFIGGLHLKFSSKKNAHEELNELNSLNVEHYVIGHCTGLDNIFHFKKIAPDSTKITVNHIGHEVIII